MWETDLEKLLAKRQIVDKCWVYDGSVNHNGYAKFDSHRFAHTVAYEVFIGPRTPGLHVMHSDQCVSKKCFNPAHLTEGDIGTNIRDAAKQGRMSNRRTNKLTREKVEEIRLRVKQGELQKDLAVEYGVAPNTISMIMANKKWKPLEKK